MFQLQEKVSPTHFLQKLLRILAKIVDFALNVSLWRHWPIFDSQTVSRTGGDSDTLMIIGEIR